MVRFRAATALIALVHAESFRKSLAFKNGPKQEGTNNDVVFDLALDAEFHRAMMAGGDKAGGIAAEMRRRRGAGRDAFAGIKNRREQRLKRDLSEAAAAGGDMIAPIVECVPELPSTDEDGDVGVLFFSTPRDDPCEEGYMCIPSNESAMGGHCISEAAASSTERDLQNQGIYVGYCPPGCPTEICECYDNYDLDVVELPQKCQDLIIETCADGSYVNYCVADYPELRAYYQGICDGYVCLADKGLFDMNAESHCDIADAECGDCFCTSYTTWCDTLRPLCDQGSTDAYCIETGGFSVVGVACEQAECCAERGGECFVVEGTGQEGGDEDDPTSAGIATADVSRNVLLGALAVSAAAPALLAALQ